MKHIVYSCSGCSNVAQACNTVALRLHREGLADMSCIAGVGGNVRPLVALATSGRPILALDGCALRCCEHSLATHNVKPTTHIVLTEHKKPGIEPSIETIEALYQQARASIDNT